MIAIFLWNITLCKKWNYINAFKDTWSRTNILSSGFGKSPDTAFTIMFNLII